MSKKFTEYSKFDLSNVNKEVLKKWKDGDIFHKSLVSRLLWKMSLSCFKTLMEGWRHLP